ncbi:unnamed protein product [Diabrotica balteata]|uniref:Uncharacterized protein n=1 Tax=Diabrotica balteata TaxID=107213 RepID=A0A9N9SZU9_DIABA|nr:unnamed protein product [Diabrotica balteata]
MVRALQILATLLLALHLNFADPEYHPPSPPLPHHPNHYPFPGPEPCDGLPDWPKEWPRYFPNGWPDDWPFDIPPGGLPHGWPHDFPNGLPHDWPNKFPHGWLPHDLPHGWPHDWPTNWPDNWREFWPDSWPNYWDDCDYPYPGYPHGPFPGPPLEHYPPSLHPPYNHFPVPEPCDGLPDWPNEWPRYFPNGWPDDWPFDIPPGGLPHDWPHDFPHGLPHDWPNKFPHGWLPHDLPHGWPHAWPTNWPDNWRDFWPDSWPNYWDDCDYPYPGYPHGPFPGPPLAHYPPSLHPPYNHFPVPEPCDGLPDWPNEWPRYFPNGWPDDWPFDIPPGGLPHDWHHNFPNGLPHDWPNKFPHGWLPHDLPHGWPHAWPTNWPDNWREFWPDSWPNYWDDCDYPYPGYPHGPFPGPPLAHHPPSPHPPFNYFPGLEPCDGLPDWPNEWPLYFPNGWPDDWPCDLPRGLPHDWPHDFPHGLPNDWPNKFPHGWLPHDLPHGWPHAWPTNWPDNWREFWPDSWPNYWDDCDHSYPGYPHGPFPGPPLAYHPPSPHPPYNHFPVSEPCDGLPDWPKEWPRYFPNGWPDDWPFNIPPGGLSHDWPHDFPNGLPHDWPNKFPHGFPPHDIPNGWPHAWPFNWPENWREFWPDSWPDYWDNCDHSYPEYPHGPFPGPPLVPHPPYNHFPVPELCDGLPDWPNEWPRYFPNGWPDDWPCDSPRDLPHGWIHDFPHGLPHDWPNTFPHGWLPHDLPHGWSNAWPYDWPENWRDFWPDSWPNYWDDCDYPYPGYRKGPLSSLLLPHLPSHYPLPPLESCETSSIVIPYPHDLPHGFPHAWPNEWPHHFPNGWPDDWPCEFPRDFGPDWPHDFPHGLPHDWPDNFPHGWPADLLHGYPNDWPREWPENWHDYWPDCWPNYWDDCDHHYPTGSLPAIPPPAENCDVFPKEFSFGVASGAYHIEGAWNQDYKSENIWDRWLHTWPSIVMEGSNGDISADAYNHIKGDIELLNNLTVRHYVFSISWSRIIYDGCGEVNPYGIEHYRTLIKLLKLNQIEPIVVLYYGDLPQSLEDQGGFLCSSFVEWYTEYARVCFEHFGDDVKYWITFHKPTTICKDGYGLGTFAPGINDGPGNYEYICGHNLLKAHAAAYHLYDDYYRSCQNGKISITLNSDWYEPQSACDTDICAAETKLQFQIGWFAHPIYIGDYPEVMIERIRLNCDYNGYYNARLPVFSHSEIEYIRGTHDFFSLAYESAFYVTAAADNYWGNICYESDVGVELLSCNGEFITYGIRPLLAWISRNYYNPSVFITNDGYGSCSRDCYDCDRIDYIKAILRNVRLSMIEDYTRVYGYTYYSYIDGFEWNLIDGRLAGYTLRYGLYDVEFDCPLRSRTARSSAAYYQHLASTGCIDDPCPSRHYYYHY